MIMLLIIGLFNIIYFGVWKKCIIFANEKQLKDYFMLVKVFKCYVSDREDLKAMLYLFTLQNCYCEKIVINDYSIKDEFSIFPTLIFHVYIEKELCNELCNIPKFKEIYDSWLDDVYDLDEMCGKDKRIWYIPTTFTIDFEKLKLMDDKKKYKESFKMTKDERIRKSLIEHIKTNCEAEKYVIKQELQREKDNTVKSMFDKRSDEIYNEKFDNKPIPIKKSRFHEGEWVVTRYGKINQVITVDEDGDGFTLDDCNYFSGSWKDEYHLWTIQDAKDGDVLVDVYGNIGIFQKNDDFDWTSYCSLGINGGFQNFKVEHENDKTHPATKEQRDLLFEKMNEAGYEWNDEKKELKKIEEEYDGEDYGIDGLWHAINILERTLGEVDGYQSDDGILEHKCAITAVRDLAKKQREQKPVELSEEDERMIDYFIHFTEHLYEVAPCRYEDPDTAKRVESNCLKRITWLKSLKERITI